MTSSSLARDWLIRKLNQKLILEFNDGDEELVFVEYFVPAECAKVWANPDGV